jgi:hypothetical protein
MGGFRRLLEGPILCCGLVSAPINDIASNAVGHEQDEVEPDGEDNPKHVSVIPDDVCVQGGHEQSDSNKAGDLLSRTQHFGRRSGLLRLVVL